MEMKHDFGHYSPMVCVNQVTEGNKSHDKRSCRNCELMSQDKKSIESLIRLSVYRSADYTAFFSTATWKFTGSINFQG